ncbi:MAG: cytochrome c, partial [Thermaceae bacterium]
LLYGLQGPIEVKGMKYNGVLPAYGQLKDEEIAALLNHIATAWGDDKKVKGFKPFTAAEVKAQRANKLTAQKVLEERKKLGLK